MTHANAYFRQTFFIALMTLNLLACSDPQAEANKSLNKAKQQFDAAALLSPERKKIEYRQIRQSLEDIARKYPETNQSIAIVGGQLIAGLSLKLLEDKEDEATTELCRSRPYTLCMIAALKPLMSEYKAQNKGYLSNLLKWSSGTIDQDLGKDFPFVKFLASKIFASLGYHDQAKKLYQDAVSKLKIEYKDKQDKLKNLADYEAIITAYFETVRECDIGDINKCYSMLDQGLTGIASQNQNGLWRQNMVTNIARVLINQGKDNRLAEIIRAIPVKENEPWKHFLIRAAEEEKEKVVTGISNTALLNQFDLSIKLVAAEELLTNFLSEYQVVRDMKSLKMGEYLWAKQLQGVGMESALSALDPKLVVTSQYYSCPSVIYYLGENAARKFYDVSVKLGQINPGDANIASSCSANARDRFVSSLNPLWTSDKSINIDKIDSELSRNTTGPFLSNLREGVLLLFNELRKQKNFDAKLVKNAYRYLGYATGEVDQNQDFYRNLTGSILPEMNGEQAAGAFVRYAKAGDLDKAQRYFDMMPDKYKRHYWDPGHEERDFFGESFFDVSGRGAYEIGMRLTDKTVAGVILGEVLIKSAVLAVPSTSQ